MSVEAVGTILVLMMLAVMAAKVAPIVSAKVIGEPLVEVTVPVHLRLLTQRNNIICLLAVLGLGSGFVGDRWIPHGLFLFTLIAMAGLVALPARYRLTSAGVSPNRATFRPWSDFLGWQTSGNVIYLRGPSRLSSLKLYTAARDRDDVLKVIKRSLPAWDKGGQPDRSSLGRKRSS